MERDGQRITVDELQLFVQVVGHLVFTHPDYDEQGRIAEIAREQFIVAREDGVRYDPERELVKALDRAYPTTAERDLAAYTGGVWLVWADVQANGTPQW